MKQEGGGGREEELLFFFKQLNAGKRFGWSGSVASVASMQLFHQSAVCASVCECLCAPTVLYSNDLVALPALICREAKKHKVSHEKSRNTEKKTDTCSDGRVCVCGGG